MESGRFILAVVLMIATVVIINVMFPPARRPAQTPASDTIPGAPAGARAQPATPPPTITAAPAIAAPAAPVASARADTIVVQSPLYRYGISTRGAALVSAELLRYTSGTRGDSLPVQLAPHALRGLISHRIRTDGETLDLSDIVFTANRNRDVVLDETSREQSVRLRGFHPTTMQPIDITYSFVPDNYTINVNVRVGGRASQLLVDIGPTLAINEANAAEDERALAYVVNSEREGIHSVPLRSVRKGQRVEEGPLAWVALKNKYFVVAAMPANAGENSIGGLVAAPAPGRFTAHLTTTLPLHEGSLDYTVYVGPQEYDRLLAMGRGLQDVNPYGWRWVRPVIRPLGHAFSAILLWGKNATGLSYGWILILFGIAVRLALWPLNAKAMRSQMKGMELQPRIQDLQKRYKEDPQAMQREMLKLYREEGFNPMGGCLPMLLPMPVLITLFFVFQSTIEFRGVPWLWLPDLSRADPFYILPIMLAVTMFIQQWLSMRSSPPNPQMKMMLWFMPGLMLVLFLNFASGLNLYYMAQNLTGFPQQLQLIKEREARQAAKKAGATSDPKLKKKVR